MSGERKFPPPPLRSHALPENLDMQPKRGSSLFGHVCRLPEDRLLNLKTKCRAWLKAVGNQEDLTKVD